MQHSHALVSDGADLNLDLAWSDNDNDNENRSTTTSSDESPRDMTAPLSPTSIDTAWLHASSTSSAPANLSPDAYPPPYKPCSTLMPSCRTGRI
jgi:hypothetical protein